MTLLQRFRKDTRGNFATMFAVSLVPIVGCTGAAVDWSNAFRQRSIVQDAIDSAALAANRKIGTGVSDAQIKQEAEYFYKANVAGQVGNPPAITTVIDKGTITITTTLNVPTAFLGIVGLPTIPFDLRTVSTAGNTRLEVAMVLDTSGSMAGTKIATLKTAATNLTDKLFTLASGSSKTDPLKMAVIPFSSAVNVGPANKTATWMDTTGKGTYHRENMQAGATKTRFDLHTDMGTSWAGCMEERPTPYDTTDDAPSTATSPTTEQAKTFFVPMFAPDEPDNWSSNTPNNYLDDKGDKSYCGNKNSITDSKDDEDAALKRVCKYQGMTPKSVSALLSLPGGPNFNCVSTAITPLTTTKSTITTAITALQAQGTTNITAGIAWGWRVLSPTAPFTEGRAYTDIDNKKVLILMTDGENTYFANGSYKKSHYGAYGYVQDKHLGLASSDMDTIEAEMDKRSKLACDNIKAVGKITIYTISFQVTTTRGKELMAYCATDANKAFDAKNETELLAAFDAIGTDLSQLRVAN